jgi:hypothetical protein
MDVGEQDVRQVPLVIDPASMMNDACEVSENDQSEQHAV